MSFTKKIQEKYKNFTIQMTAADYALADKINKKLQSILEGIKITDCDKTGKVEKNGDFRFSLEFRYEDYSLFSEDGAGSPMVDYQWDNECEHISREVRKQNSYPYVLLDANFNSEKGFFDVEIALDSKGIKMLDEDPAKLEKEMKL